MTVEWNGAAVLAAVRQGVVTGLVRGTEAVRDDAVSRINNPPKTGRIYHRRGVAHQASAPGESPAADLGNLARNVQTSVDPAALTGNVNFGSKYAAGLEFGTPKIAPRPFARPALAAKRDEIRGDLADEIGKALR